MSSRQPESPVYQFVQQRGPGLERVAFLSDDIEAEFKRVRQGGIALDDAALVDTPDGRRFAVPAEYLSGVTVEIIQPHSGQWQFDAPANISGVLGLQHIGVAVRDLEMTCKAFQRLFDLQARNLRTDQHGGEQKDAMIEPGNDRLWLHVTQSWGENARVHQFLKDKGEGLEHLCIEVDDIRAAVKRVTGAGVPLFDHKIFTNRPDGFEAFIYPAHMGGFTVELIEPYPTSRGYRERRN
jgi:4-hydroxyphenylpyruvate dioxygenase-like putative hemolysin